MTQISFPDNHANRSGRLAVPTFQSGGFRTTDPQSAPAYPTEGERVRPLEKMLQKKKRYETHTKRTVDEYSGYAVAAEFFEHDGKTDNTDKCRRRQNYKITHQLLPSPA
jgi:hypothetical protein